MSLMYVIGYTQETLVDLIGPMISSPFFNCGYFKAMNFQDLEISCRENKGFLYMNQFVLWFLEGMNLLNLQQGFV